MPAPRSLQQLELDYEDLQCAWRMTLGTEPVAWARLVEIHGEILLVERCLRLHRRDLS